MALIRKMRKGLDASICKDPETRWKLRSGTVLVFRFRDHRNRIRYTLRMDAKSCHL
jgi:hypothetical protein